MKLPVAAKCLPLHLKDFPRKLSKSVTLRVRSEYFLCGSHGDFCTVGKDSSQSLRFAALINAYTSKLARPI